MRRRPSRPITSEDDFIKPMQQNNHSVQNQQDISQLNTSFREYDADGYHVLELSAPNNHFIMKYNSDHLQIVSRKEIIYDGPSYDAVKDAVERQLRLMNQSFSELNFHTDFDAYLDWLDEELDDLDRILDDFDTRYNSYSDHPRAWESEYRYSSRRNNIYKRKSGCLGCFVWFILFIVIISIVLYGMGQLGSTIIEWIKSLF